MTLVKFKNRPTTPSFNNLMDTFFEGFPSVFNDDFETTNFKHFAPVNIKEVENGFQLEIVAPGLQKEDFKIDLDKNILTISAETKSENKEEKHIRKEYKYQSFKRSFTVDENIDSENISAQYVNGILVLNLPKQAEVKAPAKQITIA